MDFVLIAMRVIWMSKTDSSVNSFQSFSSNICISAIQLLHAPNTTIDAAAYARLQFNGLWHCKYTLCRTRTDIDGI